MPHLCLSMKVFREVCVLRSKWATFPTEVGHLWAVGSAGGRRCAIRVWSSQGPACWSVLFHPKGYLTMPALPLPMRKARLVLERFHDAGLSRRRIALHLGIGRSSVARILERAEQANLGWPLPDSLNDLSLRDALYPSASPPEHRAQPVPDWMQIHTALARNRSLTLTQLWRAYPEAHPDGYPLSQFSKRYRNWRGRSVDLVMRQTHRAGDQVFIDYSGKKPSIVDAETGEARPVERFVAVLGASNYLYAEASLTQQAPDLCASRVRAFEFFGGVPRIVVPDNLKAAVTRFKRHDEPILDPSFQDSVLIRPSPSRSFSTTRALPPTHCASSGACTARQRRTCRRITRPSWSGRASDG